jgi:hypothetical protein
MKDDKVVFFKDSHTYWHGDTKLNSVGSWIKRYYPPFQESYWLTHKVLTKLIGQEYTDHYRSFKRFNPPADVLYPKFMKKVSPSDFERERRILLDQWGRKREEAAFNGSNFHDKMEAEAYAAGELWNPWEDEVMGVHHRNKSYDNESDGLDLSKLDDGCHLELLLFDLELGVAGQADIVFIKTIGKKRHVWINDHKTNEKKPSKSSPEYCLPPFRDQYASTHFKYTLQLNSYGFLLERHKFHVEKLGYTYYKNFDPTTAELVEVNNLGNRSDIFQY